MDIATLVNTAAYPLSDTSGGRFRELAAAARHGLRQAGSFNLDGFLRPEAVARAAAEIEPLMARASFHHSKDHNIYFTDEDPPVPAGHGARRRLTSSNHTLTCDQLDGTVVRRVYEWDGLRDFLAAVFERPLYRMADPLARLNVLGYGPGDQLSWHFDRAEFTVTLLVQEAERDGVFEYRRNLRGAEAPNHDGVACLLAGADPEVRALELNAGTLNVFMGYRSPHRVTKVAGSRMRLVAVLSFMEQPGVQFSAADRLRFYGRTGEGQA